MTLLALQEPGLRLGLKAGSYTLRRGEVLVRTLPVHQVDEVHLYGAVELSARARHELLKRGSDVLIFDRRGKFLGRLLPPESPHAARRRSQYRHLDAPARALTLARSFVRGKLDNQRVVLRRAHHHAPPDIDVSDTVTALRLLRPRVEAATTTDELRGVEGHAAALYFRAWGKLLRNPQFRFEARRRRPPPDPVNALLSFAYTGLCQRAETALRRAGLDPHLGALHEPGRNRPSLALDLAEELRPAIDRLALRLFNLRRLCPDDFEDPRATTRDVSIPGVPTDADGIPRDDVPVVYLGPTGRAILLREVQSMWKSRLRGPLDDAQRTLSDLIDGQAHQLAAIFEGRREEYAPLALS